MIETHLLIDDFRDLKADVIARNYHHGIACLLTLRVTHLYMDHDLGEEKTGYDVLKFLFYHILKDFKIDPPKFIQLVTSNPVGRENMKKLLISEGYTSKNEFDFYK